MAKLREDAIKQNFTIQDLVPGKKNEIVWLGGMTHNLTKLTLVGGYTQHANGSNATVDIQNRTVIDQCGTLQVTNTNFKVTITNKGCHNSHQFICRLGEWHNSPVTYISEQSATWSEAKSRCFGLQGDLFHLKSDDNIQHLETKLMSFRGKTFFVGLNHEQWAWKWEDGTEVLHYNWLSDEHKSEGDCLMIYSWPGKWNALHCDAQAYTLCQNGSTMEAGSTTEAPSQVSGTENSYKNTLIKAPHNTRVIIITLGSLLAVASVVIMICFVYVISGKCKCWTNTEQEIPTTDIMADQEYTYIEISEIRHVESRSRDEQGTLATLHEEGSQTENPDESSQEVAEGSPTGNDESNPGSWPTVEQEEVSDQTEEQRNNRQVDSAIVQDVDDDGYIVARSGTDNMLVMSEKQSLENPEESVATGGIDFENLPSAVQSEAENGDDNGNVVENEYDHLGASEAPDELNGGNRNSVEKLYTLLKGARK